MSKRIILLGSTGSIGRNTLQCIEANPDLLSLTALSTHSQIDVLLEQCRRFRPRAAAISGAEPSSDVIEELLRLNVELFAGEKALVRLIERIDAELVVNAVVGAAGFLPTLAAVEKGCDVALANKESLVIGGEHVMRRAAEKNVRILPVDSEHSAVFQCLMGEDVSTVEEILLTGSGGPFRLLPKEKFSSVTVEEALKHPNWSMGAKITIDSATMMNKGLEVIEACRLFGLTPDRVRVVVHPQSIVHSMVAFRDGSVKAQLGKPDMRVPIQLALTWPERRPSEFPRMDFSIAFSLDFEPPDLEKFRCLALAYQALESGGTSTAVLNAANEIAVQRFLRREIRFDQIEAIIEQTLSAHQIVRQPSIEELLAADEWARNIAGKIDFD
ncbi:MAG: 1-deoxy-D-xylulose-5-phosphate reductoisomerase [candidate division KSB1 bacterium]|nr:1-deoxy-D-xylulose-5-phosphate reductoisomerase [candidate division KSB1 bacterium]